MLAGGQDELGEQDALPLLRHRAESGIEGGELRLDLREELPMPGPKQAPEALPRGVGGPDGLIDPAEGAHGLVEAADALLDAGNGVDPLPRLRELRLPVLGHDGRHEAFLVPVVVVDGAHGDAAVLRDAPGRKRGQVSPQQPLAGRAEDPVLHIFDDLRRVRPSFMNTFIINPGGRFVKAPDRIRRLFLAIIQRRKAVQPTARTISAAGASFCRRRRNRDAPAGTD